MQDLNRKLLSQTVACDHAGGLSSLRFNSLLAHSGLIHGVFTRKGGKSLPPYDSLNVSFNTGDLAEMVRENLRLIKGVIGASDLISMNQVHGTETVILHRGDAVDLSIRSADAIITDIPMLGIMVKQADCQGVVLYDPVRSVVAAVHCGWRGNVLDILGSVVRRMSCEFGCKPEDLAAGIGPSLGPCCAEFKTYQDIFPEEFRDYMVKDNHFDLWGISRMQLERAGLKRWNIGVAGICTKCNPDIFYSYRGEGDTGRFGTVAMLKNK